MLIQNRALDSQELDLLHPLRMLFGDVYLVFRVLFVATMTPVSAMLIANAKGVQVIDWGRSCGTGLGRSGVDTGRTSHGKKEKVACAGANQGGRGSDRLINRLSCIGCVP